MFARGLPGFLTLAVFLMTYVSPISAAATGPQSVDIMDIGDTEVRQVVDFNTTDVGHTLEARVPPAVIVQGAKLAIDGIKSIVNGIKNGIKADKKARGEFTLHLVGEMRKKYPKFNWVVCHTKHETKFKGQRGKDWSHRHEEFDIKIGGTVGYEIYNFKAGTFIRKGDGGYLNWAYSGRVTKKSGDGKTITFAAP